MVMTCPEDKFIITSAYLREWLACTSLSLKQSETAVGLLSWASAGLPTLFPCVAPLIHMRTALGRMRDASRISSHLLYLRKTDYAA